MKLFRRSLLLVMALARATSSYNNVAISPENSFDQNYDHFNRRPINLSIPEKFIKLSKISSNVNQHINKG
jgi:hypothetical protein